MEMFVYDTVMIFYVEEIGHSLICMGSWFTVSYVFVWLLTPKYDQVQKSLKIYELCKFHHNLKFIDDITRNNFHIYFYMIYARAKHSSLRPNGVI